jgi:hypothetical protein
MNKSVQALLFSLMIVSLSPPLSVQAAKRNSGNERIQVRSAPPEALRARTKRTITPDTNPQRLISYGEWERYLRTQMPEIGVKNLSSFWVYQQRKYENGEIKTPANGTTF